MSTLLPPRLVTQGTDDSLECSVHTLPKQLMREFRHVFADKYLPQEEQDAMLMDASKNTDGNNDNRDILAIPTNQKARKDLVAIGDDIELEKDRLLNVFISFGQDLCLKIRARGYWADYIDPCSGLPMLTTNCNKVYSEVDGMECLLNYKSYNAGFCKILTHPQWGSAVYPATMFAHAPASVVLEIINQYPLAAKA